MNDETLAYDPEALSAAIEGVAIEEMEAWKEARFKYAYDYAKRIADRVVAIMAEDAGLDGLASQDSVQPWCSCGRRQSECDGSRLACHSSRTCRWITLRVSDDFCDRCRRLARSSTGHTRGEEQ